MCCGGGVVVVDGHVEVAVDVCVVVVVMEGWCQCVKVGGDVVVVMDVAV